MLFLGVFLNGKKKAENYLKTQVQTQKNKNKFSYLLSFA